MNETKPNRPRGADWIVSLGIVVIALVVFGQVIVHDFVNFDDDKYIYADERIQEGLTLENITWVFTTPHVYNWHPLTSMSHMLDSMIFGLNAGGHHAMNLFIHVLNALLLLGILRSVTGQLAPSAFVAVLFAFHPLHVESVAWASERKDTLSAFWGFLTIAAYLRYVKSPSKGRYALIFLPFALGLMSKQMLVTWPCVLLLLDFWPLHRITPIDNDDQRFPATTIKKCIVEKIPLLAVSIAASVTAYMVQAQSGLVRTFEAIPIAIRLENAVVTYATYLYQTAWPAKLSIFYPHPMDTIPGWKTVLAVILLMGVSVSVIFLRRHRYLLVGWFWYLGTLVPVIGLVQVGLQAHADRYTYLPLIGIFIMIAFGLAEFTRRSAATYAVVAMAITAALLPATWRQTAHWRNSTTLFSHALNVTTGNYWAHNALGFTQYHEGKIDAAERHFEQAILIKPNYPDAHYNLAIIQEETRRTAQAMASYQEALEINPRHVGANYNLGNLLGKDRKFRECIPYFETVLESDPDHVGAHVGLGMAALYLNRRDEAKDYFRQALELDPDNHAASVNLENMLLRDEGRE